MSEASRDGWFYTQQGNQHGPVAFAELQRLARGGELNPRLDMAWTQGMTDWKPAGEIEDLFEKHAAVETPQALAPAADPCQPPQQNEITEATFPEGGWPGARRRSLYLITLVFPILWGMGFGAATPLLQQQCGAEITGMVTIGAMFVPWILAIVYGLQRLVNLGMSRWWYLGNAVPFLNLWIGYRMFACPAGYAYHKKLDGAGVALAIIYWLMVLLTILIVVSIFALMFGVVGSPEILQQLEEAFRNMSKGAN